MSLTVEEYSEKAIVVRGETKEFKDDLTRLGGKFNGLLKNGPGWIFSKKNQSKIEEEVEKLNRTEKKVEKTKGDITKTILGLVEKLSIEEKLNIIAEIAGCTVVKSKVVSKIIGKTPVPLVKKVVEEEVVIEEDEEDQGPVKSLLFKQKD